MMEVLNAKTQTRLGFWNVRPLFERGKLAQATSEMNRYNLHSLGVGESRWTGAGRQRTVTDETALYCGRDDNMHFEGVAISEERTGEIIDIMETSKKQNYNGQTKRQTQQLEHHTMLRSNKRWR